MKYRKDFVTNSSSSSYICEICGEVVSGMDASLRDCEMMQCINGHVFCADEALAKPSKTEMIKMVLEDKYNKEHYSEQSLNNMTEERIFDEILSEDGYYDVPECVCPICQFIEYSEQDMSAFLLKEYGVPRDEVLKMVKTINKRRKKLYDSDYIAEACRRFNLIPADIVATWKNRFGTYANFAEYLRR